VLGGVLAFAVFLFLTGQTFGWLRFTIAAVPLAAILSGCLLADEGIRPGNGRTSRRPGHLPWLAERWFIRSALAAAVATVLLAPSLPATAWAMSDRHLGREEQLHLSWVLHGARTQVDRRERDRFRTVQGMAKYLDRRHLPDGSIVVDPVTPCISWLVLASRHPRQFVIPNDRDFEALLADPQAFNVRYLLPPSPQDGLSVFDVINRTYPGLYEHGASLAELTHEFTDPACPRFRLYRVTKPTADQPGQAMPTGRGG
jgi:hypothetical protein